MTGRLPRRAVFLIALAAVGCGRGGPSSDSASGGAGGGGGAKAALETALAAWKKGEPADRLEGGRPSVHVAVADWQAGKGLDGYEVVSEEPGPSDATKYFSVKLKPRGGKGETTTRFVVTGRDPVWVYGENDFKKVLNLENTSTPTGKAKGR